MDDFSRQPLAFAGLRGIVYNRLRGQLEKFHLLGRDYPINLYHNFAIEDMDKKLIIAIDFDGTIVTHEYPRIGKLASYAKEVINKLVDKGHEVFLWTMRDDRGKNMMLSEAMMFLEDEGINIHKFNRSPAQFSTSPKQFAHIYIDDAMLGMPIIDTGEGRTVNWAAITYLLTRAGVFSKDEYTQIIGED